MSAEHPNFFHTDAAHDLQRLRDAMAAAPSTLRVICYCAAWCQACQGYLPALRELAPAYPATWFVWVDIEHRPDWLGDEDVEDFPTVLLQDGDGNRYFGPLPERIDHLRRLLDNPPPRLLPAGPPSLASLLA